MAHLPLPPVHSFASDNAAGVSPEVLDALGEANVGTALAYGDDDWTHRMQAAMRDVFDAPVMSFPCWGGTGANVVGLSSVLQGWQAVIAADTSHIVVDECGAPVRFSGSTIVPIPTADGKLRPDHLEPYLHWLGTEHHVQPRVVSITQSTEMGTLYSVDEIGALGEACRGRGLLLHLDGARLANALVALETDVPTMVRDTGVDVLTFGLTKDGAMYGETVVFVDPGLAERALFIRKQAGQLPSKARFVSAQVLALLEDDLWLRNAAHANAMAQKLMGAVAGVPGVSIETAPAVNAIFPVLPAGTIEPLQDWSFFWPWDLTQSMVRWMTSFATTDEDVDRFAAGVRAIVAGP